MPAVQQKRWAARPTSQPLGKLSNGMIARRSRDGKLRRRRGLRPRVRLTSRRRSGSPFGHGDCFQGNWQVKRNASIGEPFMSSSPHPSRNVTTLGLLFGAVIFGMVLAGGFDLSAKGAAAPVAAAAGATASPAGEAPAQLRGRDRLSAVLRRPGGESPSGGGFDRGPDDREGRCPPDSGAWPVAGPLPVLLRPPWRPTAGGRQS